MGGSGAQTLQSKGHAGWEPGTREGKLREQSWHRGRREAKARPTWWGDGREKTRKDRSGRAASISKGELEGTFHIQKLLPSPVLIAATVPGQGLVPEKHFLTAYSGH